MPIWSFITTLSSLCWRVSSVQPHVDTHPNSSAIHTQDRIRGTTASRIHHSSTVSLDRSQRLSFCDGFLLCAQTLVPYTIHPSSGLLSHSMCSRRCFMRRLKARQHMLQQDGDDVVTYDTLPRQNLRSLPRSHRTWLGHFKCSMRLDMSHSTLTLTPVSTMQ